MFEAIPEHLGQADAADEWKDIEEANSRFVSIESYEEFAKPSCAFLVGRIGTGKTALLNKLKHSIETFENQDYKAVVMLDAKESIMELSMAIRLSDLSKLNYSEMETYLFDRWLWTINTVVMNNICSAYEHIYPKEVQVIKSYLESVDILKTKSSPQDIIKQIHLNLSQVDNVYAQGIAAIFGILQKLTSPLYETALKETKAILRKRGKLLILIDSIERYEFNDPITLAVLNSLFKTCLEFYRDDSPVYIKLAVPSEVIPKLSSINLEKISGKIVYIRWSYHDLKAMIAIRLFKYKNRLKGEVDREEAITFFDTYYNDMCLTPGNFLFPTFAYCLINTQKKPRQIISIYNSWIQLEQKYPKKNRMDLINDAINYNAEYRVRGALSIYESVHPGIFDMFRMTFANRKYCFTTNEFDSWLKDCSNIRGELSANELKSIFVSSGLVGIQLNLHYIPEKNSKIKNEQVIRIKEVVFEYQIKDKLTVNQDTKLCLHSMCYGVFNNTIDLNTLVYPKPAEDEYTPW